MALQTLPTLTPSGYLVMAVPPPAPADPQGINIPYYAKANTLALPAGSGPDKVVVENVGPEPAFVLLTTAAATTTGTAAAGAKSVALASGTGVAPGQAVIGTGVAEGTTVTGVPNGAILTGAITAANAGTGYSALDVVTVTQSGGSAGTFRVDTVDGGGAVTGLTQLTAGTGYATAGALATTVAPSGGTGLKVDITASNSLVLDRPLLAALSTTTLKFVTQVTPATGMAVQPGSAEVLAYGSFTFISAIVPNGAGHAILDITVGV